MIVKRRGFYEVQSSEGRNLGRYQDLIDAKHRLRQIEFFKYKGRHPELVNPRTGRLTRRVGGTEGQSIAEIQAETRRINQETERTNEKTREITARTFAINQETARLNEESNAIYGAVFLLLGGVAVWTLFRKGK
jgi:hypothetical protein